MTTFSGGYGDFIVQLAGLVKESGILFLHTHGAAAATDIAGQSKQLLDRNKLHILVAGGLGSFFKAQLTAYGDAE